MFRFYSTTEGHKQYSLLDTIFDYISHFGSSGKYLYSKALTGCAADPGYFTQAIRISTWVGFLAVQLPLQKSVTPRRKILGGQKEGATAIFVKAIFLHFS